MKIRVQNRRVFRKPFRWSAIVAIAGFALSGCRGNGPAIFPADWNVEDALSLSVSPLTASSAAQAMPASAGLIGGLQRQPDCSLTYLDFSYAIHATAATVVPHSRISHFETTLHDNALLNTTANRFLSGCGDTSLGTSSRPFLFLGQDKSGREFIAMPGTSGVVTSGIKSDGTYTQPATLNTPVKSISLLSGDLNRDGNADLISVNSDGRQSSVTVFLGKGDGAYQTSVNYALPGANAQYGVLDDLNGDGIPDLLVSSASPTFAFSVLIGNGDGTFQQPQTFVPTNASLIFNNAFITADVNGDGKKDIVTAQGQIFLGTGDGASYSPQAQPAFQSTPASTADLSPSIVAADFNHDGRMDLATDDGSAIRIYLGNGDGTFSAGSTYSTIQNSGLLLATDLDGDGNIDLWSGYGGSGVYSGDAYIPDAAYALMGKGDGTFGGTAGLPASLAFESAAMAHAIPDATSSLTISSPVPGTITVVAGQTSPAFVVVVSSPTNTPQSVTLACSGLPVLATCIFPTSLINLTANVNSAQVSIMIATGASGNAIPWHRVSPAVDWVAAEWWLAAGMLATIICLRRTPRRNLKWAFRACLLVMMSSIFVGCSSNSSSTSSGGTPAGTYSITISANGAGGTPVSTPNTLTLKVTQ